MQPNSPIDLYCKSLKNLGKIEPMSDQETISNFHELQSIRDNMQDTTITHQQKSILAYRQKKLVERIVTSCLPYVLKLAKDYARGTDDSDLLSELVSEGNLGLCRAVPKYDPDAKVPFRTYAAFWIKAGFLSCLKRHQKLVKSANNTALTLYVAEQDRIPDTNAASEPETRPFPISVAGLAETLASLTPLEQIVYRMKTGVFGNRPMSYADIGTLLAMPNKNNVVIRALSQEVSKKVSAIVFKRATTSPTSCDEFDEQKYVVS